MFCWCSWCDIVIYTRGYFVCYIFLLVVSVLHDLLGIFCVQKTWGWQVASLRFLEVSCWTSFRRIQPMILNIDPWWFGVFCYQELGPQNWDTTFWIVKIAEKRTTWTDDTVAFKKMPRCENSGEEKHVFFCCGGTSTQPPNNLTLWGLLRVFVGWKSGGCCSPNFRDVCFGCLVRYSLNHSP